MLEKIFALLVAIRTLFVPCPLDCNKKDQIMYKIYRCGTLPVEVNESSGLIYDQGKLLTINDSGGEPVLYVLDSILGIINILEVPGVVNHDWEALAIDSSRYFIGDIGNNANDRKDLKIIMFYPAEDSSSVIDFYYPEQEDFGSLGINAKYDAEGLFYMKDRLFILSKNQQDKNISLYSLPSIAGRYPARLEKNIPLNEKVTGASFHPKKNLLAILTYGKIILYRVNHNDNDFTLELFSCKKFFRAGQSEAITFTNDLSLAVTNEKGKVFIICPKMKKNRKN